MPLSLEEASRRFTTYTENMQDSILVMESLMGDQVSFDFNMPQVITNLETVNISTEERNVAAKIKILEEYQKVLNWEKKRRSVKEVTTRKTHTDDLKTNLKNKRKSQRLGIIFKSNILSAFAAAGQVPPRASSQVPPRTSSQVPPQASSQASSSQVLPQASQASFSQVSPQQEEEEEMMFDI